LCVITGGSELIRLQKSKEHEVASFMEMDRAEGTSEFIVLYSKETHLAELLKKDVHYLSIFSKDLLVGYVILVVENDMASVEFRRIVVGVKGKGIGQSAIIEMEIYCTQTLACSRIWLDVFEVNERGKHI